MINKSHSSEFDDLKEYVQSIYDNIGTQISGVVDEKTQLKEIELLKETMSSNDRFFFVIDMQSFKISHVHGVQKWLGYSEKEFTLKYYWDKVVHPSRKNSLLIIVKQMYELLAKGTYPMEFMVQRFSTLVPLRHYNGHYILTKKTASVFQHDKDNRLMAYMDEFTIINHEFNGEPMNPTMYNSEGELEVIKQQEILRQAFEYFISMKVFSMGEMQAIRLLAYNPKYTQKQISEKLGVSVHTVDTYYKRFLGKAREFYHLDFATVMEAANYLRREGLI